MEASLVIDPLHEGVSSRPSSRPWWLLVLPLFFLCHIGEEVAPGAGHLRNLIDRGIDGIKELNAQVVAVLLIPAAGTPILGVRFILEPNARIHCRRSSASARRRTSSHGTPAVSPVITRRARRSISSAQAASTSAGSAAAASSRLARSCAATSARSFTGNAKASRRSSCARGDIKPFYTPSRWPNIVLGTV